MKPEPAIVGYRNGRPVYLIAGGSTTVEDLSAKREEVVNKGRELTGKEDLSDEEMETLRGLTSELDTLDTELETLEKNQGDLRTAKDKFGAAKTPADEGRMRTGNIYGRKNEDQAPAFQTPGEAFVDSEAYQGWLAQFPAGGPTAEGMRASSNAVDVNGVYRDVLNMRTATEKWRGGTIGTDRMRALVTSADASAGLWVSPERRGLIEPGLTRPLTIRQMVTVLPTQSDAIEYIREASRIAAAAPVTEAVQLLNAGDVTATKPEGGLTFQTVTDVVKSIALWVPATNRILSDAPQLRAYIDSYLTDDIAIELEDQMISGTGGAGFTGLFNTAGIQVLGPPAGALTELDLIYRAKRLVRLNARTNATAVFANGADIERWVIQKAGTALNSYAYEQAFAAAGTVQTVWGLPLIESEACPVGHAMVGDFRRAILFDRESTRISVGTADQDFIRNIVRILAEMRAGFGVIRPASFVDVDLVP